jgi:hypothetical protein
MVKIRGIDSLFGTTRFLAAPFGERRFFVREDWRSIGVLVVLNLERDIEFIPKTNARRAPRTARFF